ncbi:Neuronal pentraxin receptor [Dissostichus eleginoides]|uniref:Neuronal pentraxin receptor n=1 Tax=Dissostichus eleginoides TaxID=100907 RepID=A0AAD9F3N3_DISEL|nr:Neuronal pentraxin receptor [Dissostichus eleginoides]
MKFVLVLVGAGSLAFLGAVICIIASVYPRKHASFPGDNSTLGPEALMEPLEPLELTGSDSYRGENGLGGLEVPGLNHVHLGEDTGGGSAKQFSFSRLICTPVPVGECRGNMKDLKRQQQADQPEEDWSFLRTTAEDLRQMVVQQNDQILMDQRTIRELTGKLNECESGLEDERNVPERSIGVWSGNRRVMAGDDVSSSAAAQLQTARAVEELARAIMDLKDRIEKLEVNT